MTRFLCLAKKFWGFFTHSHAHTHNVYQWVLGRLNLNCSLVAGYNLIAYDVENNNGDKYNMTVNGIRHNITDVYIYMCIYTDGWLLQSGEKTKNGKNLNKIKNYFCCLWNRFPRATANSKDSKPRLYTIYIYILKLFLATRKIHWTLVVTCLVRIEAGTD